ncbi:hypothetical protein ABT025_06340 [Streptomyces sp. NPDC002809]|uniref:hypothetical protein n=1 Tax=Streptomyces sp. NPDC002809 TaxID=3154433 RepID=UPI00331AE593
MTPHDLEWWITVGCLRRRLGPSWSWTAHEKRAFDSAGIPPHIRTPVFTGEEFATDSDSAFDAAVVALREQKLS